jgi:hypothetical protein
MQTSHVYGVHYARLPFVERRTSSVLRIASLRYFPATQTLTAKWASTDSVLCFAGGHLQCADLQLSPQTPGANGTEERPHMPTIVAPAPLGAPIPPAPRSIACGIDPVFIDSDKQGRYTVKLVVMIGKNGTVTSVETQGGSDAGYKLSHPAANRAVDV